MAKLKVPQRCLLKNLRILTKNIGNPSFIIMAKTGNSSFDDIDAAFKLFDGIFASDTSYVFTTKWDAVCASTVKDVCLWDYCKWNENIAFLRLFIVFIIYYVFILVLWWPIVRQPFSNKIKMLYFYNYSLFLYFSCFHTYFTVANS